MAMTKKERAEFDAALRKANTLGALRWTEKIKRDLPAPNYNTDRAITSISGWDFNAYSGTVDRAWSEMCAHGSGPERTLMGGAQGGRSLYSTRLLAIKAMRNAIEEESAERLRKVDEIIANEELKREEIGGIKNETGNP